MEVTLKFIQYRRFINRGYLIGPYCPIYGCGAVLITLLAGGVFIRKFTPLETYFAGFVICGALEYAVSYVMEKVSHARWWDYSTKPMNLNGRIWIGNLILFGLAAVGIVYIANPFLFGLFARVPQRAQSVCACIFLVVLLADSVVSHFLTRIVRDCIETQEADNTEQIREEMHKMLRDRALLLRRISHAYPNLQPRPNRLLKALKSARAEYREASKRFKRETEALSELLRKRRQISEDISEAVRERVKQAREAKKAAAEKLRELQDGFFGSDK